MNDNARSYWHLGAVTVVGLLAVASVLIYPQASRHEGRSSASFSIWIQTDRPGTAQLYYDLGGGFAERLSSRVDLKPGAAPTEHKFALPSGRVVGLRFDPADHDASVTLARAAIQDMAGKVLTSFSAGDFIAAQQIARIDRLPDEKGVAVTATPGATDRYLFLNLSAPLMLPDAGPAQSAPQRQQSVRVQRWLAAGLLAAGGCILGLIWRQIRRLGFAAKPAPWLERITILWVGFCVVFSRRPDVITLPQFWAEDGTIFFAQRHLLGWKAALLTHGGYLHFIPRLTAGVADFFSIACAPILYLCAALIVVGVAMIKAISARVALPYPYWCALAIVLVPNMDEIAFNVTNAQWFGAIALLLIACSRPPTSRLQVIVETAAAVVFGLSGPFSVLLFPLFIVRAFRWRSPAAIATTAMLAVAGALQLVAYATAASPPNTGGAFHFVQAAAAIGFRTGGQLLNILPASLASPPLAWGMCSLLLWLVLWTLLPTSAEFRFARVLTFAAACLILAGGIWRYRETVGVFFNPIHVQRYVHLPLVVTFWLLLAALQSHRGRKPAALILAVVVVCNAPWYRVAPNIDYDWSRFAAQLERGQPIDAPINPAGWILSVRPQN